MRVVPKSVSLRSASVAQGDVSAVGFAIALLALFVVALLPRVWGLNDFYTIDEAYHWPGRVQRFRAALQAHTWAATNQTGHPGVTTMWLGALGNWLAARAGVTDPGWAGGGALYLSYLRLPLAVTNAVAVLIGVLLLVRLLGRRAALLAGLFWAASPFLIAHSRVLHLDALVTSGMTLSVLALLNGLAERQSHEVAESRRVLVGRGYLALSGVFGGLALLTKAPSLVLLPFVGLALAWALWPRGGGGPTVAQLWRGWVLPVLGWYVAWLLVATAVVFAGWPAMWVDPLGAAGSVVREIIHNGGEPHHSGNYFLGQAVGAPGPLFYPAVVLFRTAPWTLLGLVFEAVALLAWLRRRGPASQFHLLVALYVLLFGVAMSAEPKQFDRYLLPIWPALEILAAIGWVRLLRVGATRARARPTAVAPYATSAVVLVLALGMAATLFSTHPYYQTYFNPLVGGGPAAQHVMLVGWGEGMEQVGAWLQTRPDLGRGPVLSWIPPTLAPFVPKEHLVLDLRDQYVRAGSSYAVLYSRSVQRKENAVAEAYVRQSPVLHRVVVNGVELATIHQLPRPYAVPTGATFDDSLLLRGFTQAQVGSTVVITPSWSVERDMSGGVLMFVHVLNERGENVAQLDAALDQGMFGAWQAGQQFDSPLPLPLPAEPGSYRVVIGVYRPDTGRLPFAGVAALPDAVDGPNALLLTELRVP